MCMMCEQSSCHSMCPNAPEPRYIGGCNSCARPIYTTEDYYELPGGTIYHSGCLSSCVSGFEVLELMTIFGKNDMDEDEFLFWFDRITPTELAEALNAEAVPGEEQL